MTLGRLPADRFVARYGRPRIVQSSALVAGLGALVIVAVPTEWFALGGWALLGAGVSSITPTVLGATPAMSSAPASAAIAAVSTVGCLGSFAATADRHGR